MSREAAISVSELNRRARRLLEQGFARLWVEGEISNLSRPASGHIYLTLKDNGAEVSAAWFRQRQRGPANRYRNGDQVRVYGRVSLYEARGNFQLIVEEIEPAGEGVLKRRFDALKKKLAAEGLFDEEKKLPLPRLPERIGVITSPTGAALRDILAVLRQRFPAVPVLVYPSAVQGDAAPGQLIQALETANRRAECDLLILARGGGSLEDLWAFNDEALARSIAASGIPIVSAVGHEVDFSITDFVADLRAPTPSAAAELVVPDSREWRRSIRQLAARLARTGQRSLDDRSQSLDWLARRLARVSPAATVDRQAEMLDNLRRRATMALRHRLQARFSALDTAFSGLLARSPSVKVQRLLGAQKMLSSRLTSSTDKLLADKQHRLKLAARALNAVSPLATLDRGYAIVSTGDGKRVLSDSRDAPAGTVVRARLAHGELFATVDSTTDDD